LGAGPQELKLLNCIHAASKPAHGCRLLSDRLVPAARAAFLVCVAVAIPIQAIGAFYYPHGNSDEVLNQDFTRPWKLENAQFLLELRNGPAPLPFTRSSTLLPGPLVPRGGREAS
jgi:hypothetical protein